MKKILFKPKYIGDLKLYCQYYIFYGKQKIGEISFIKKKNIFVIGYLKIFEYYQKRHYGYEVINYILSHYKVDCIIGQSLHEARGFWNKCIKKYDGQRKNIILSNSCSSSFVIPRYKIRKEEIIHLLEIGYQIE